MDLRQLTYLVAVAEEGGIRAAARRLHIAQPQVSHALRRLEGELGVELMQRSPRGIELTPEGRELLVHGRDILDRVDQARASLRQMADPGTKALRIGVMAGVLSAGELLAPILAAYRQARPDVALQIEDLAFGAHVAPLIAGRLDVAIVRIPVSDPGLEVTPLAEEPRVVMVGAGHEVADASLLALEEILHYPTLPLDAPSDWADYWQLNDYRGASNWDATVAPARTVPEAQFALATHNLLITSPCALGRLAPNPLVRVIELTGATPTVIAVIHKRRDRRPALTEFVETARDTAGRFINLLPAGAVPH
jgi:DNA-binding transcriptional LysR family regulator